ncbi:VirB4 family type IV secretion system protein [Phytohabitans houttuyneae]|uniref:VirB4 family type IV secretion system protein n=1 Tax=Phytohabitans houttuyneae TaxID=1076126 RepID=UPI001564B826|nr:conjugal transfer protein TraC [Phytohabitans houttuyneae]
MPRRTRPGSATTAPQQAGGAAALGPASVEVAARHLQVGDGYAAVLIVTHYPAEVSTAWLEPLLSWPGRLDLTLHIEPVPAVVAASRLRAQRARLETVRRSDADRGRLDDPNTDAAAGDAAELADRVARGAARLYRVGIYLTVHCPSLDELVEAVAEVRATAASVLLDTVPATWRQLQGWTSGLPLGVDSLGMRRVFDSDSLACAFPLACADLPAPLPGDPPQPGGVLYGLNTATAGVVWWDRWTAHNYNSIVLARSGAGKSYFIKLEIVRSLLDGVVVQVVDPEDEYIRLATAVGGTVVQLGAAGVRINPLDIPTGDCHPEAFNRRVQFIRTLVAVMLGTDLAAPERAAVETAVLTAYEQAGIDLDPASWSRPAPLLRDVAAALHTGDPVARALAGQLAPWTSGSLKDVFDGPSTTVPTGQLVVWSTRQLSDELRPAAMLLALDAIWRQVEAPAPHVAARFPRQLVIVDEAWKLLGEGAGAKFLATLAKSARKRRAGLSVVTQDAADVLATTPGRTVLANCATQILMRQDASAIGEIGREFGLTSGEARLLLSARRGEGLLLSGGHRVGFQVVSSSAEHVVCTDGDRDVDGGQP